MNQFVDYVTFAITEGAEEKEVALPSSLDTPDINRLKHLERAQLTQIGGGISWGGEYSLETDSTHLRESLNAVWKRGDCDDHIPAGSSEPHASESGKVVSAQVWRILVNCQGRLVDEKQG